MLTYQTTSFSKMYETKALATTKSRMKKRKFISIPSSVKFNRLVINESSDATMKMSNPRRITKLNANQIFVYKGYLNGFEILNTIHVIIY